MSVLAQVLCRKHAAAGQRNETARDASDKYHLSQHANRDVVGAFSRVHETHALWSEDEFDRFAARDSIIGRGAYLNPVRTSKTHNPSGFLDGRVDNVGVAEKPRHEHVPRAEIKL